jgi:NAD(P)-dependent dehydrogenase (short-subunit alcohol dehydrogenase family)
MALERFRLDGQTALVTGGGRGIGLAIAETLLEAGATVIVADIDPKSGAAVAGKLGEQARFLQLDVTHPDQVAKVAEKIGEDHGGLDVLINNAGVCVDAPATETTNEIWRTQLAVNLDGVFYCCREFGRRMVERGRGSIVNMSSIAGLIDIRPQNHIAYSTAKAGVIQLSKVLASEWARHNVRVNAIAPGYVATDMPMPVGGSEFLETWKSLIPTGRLLSADEIGYAVLFLASSASSSVTGQVLVTDSGYTVW